MELLLTNNASNSTASTSTYYNNCCNQATAHNHQNYATAATNMHSSVDSELLGGTENKYNYEELLKCFQTLVETSLLRMLAGGVIKSEQSNAMAQPKVVHVGNKPTRQREPLDFSSMPQVVNVIANEERLAGNMITASVQAKRGFNETDPDETDSSFDYSKSRIDSKRLKHSCLSSSSSASASNAIAENWKDMNEGQLWDLACKYGRLNEYRSVALALGVDETDIQIIESKHLARDGLKECFYQCLLTWRLNQPDSCSLERFADTLATQLEKCESFVEELKQRLVAADSGISGHAVVLEQYMSKYGVGGEVKLDEGHFWDASGLMAQHWKQIGRSLGLRELDLTTIEARYLFTDGIRECCYQALLLWSQVAYEAASLEYLCLRLIGMKFNLFAKQLIEMIAH